ncbi:uncharacterized protein YndB with AHSA1/START domain [Mucilaginibacter sp. UYNi724]
MENNSKTKIVAEPNKQDFFITREFDAPKEIVFKAFALPDLFVQWFLPAELKMEIEVMDCKTGGNYRHFHKHQNGMQFGFRGVFHEVTLFEKIVKTSEFEGLPQKMDAVLETTTFENIDNAKTKVTIHTVCSSSQFRDGMISNGMEKALDTAHKQLDKLLQSLNK